MPTLTTDNPQRKPLGSGISDNAVKTHTRTSQQDAANPETQRTLSVASLEQFVRDHLAEVKNMPLSELAGTGVESLVHEALEEQKQEDEKSPYSIAAGAAQQKASDEQSAKDEQEREYEAHTLTTQELVQFNQTVTQYRTDSQKTHNDLDQWQSQLDQEQKDIQSREIAVNGHHYAFDDKTGKYYDVDSKKDVDPNKDPALKAQLDKLRQSDTTKTSEIDKHSANQKEHDNLQSQQNANDNTVNTAANKNKKTGADQNDVNGADKSSQDIDKRVTSEMQSQSANRTAALQSQINVPSPSGSKQPQTPQQSAVVENEKKNKEADIAVNKESLATESNRLNKLAPVETKNSAADLMHARFAALQAQGTNNQPNNSASPTTPTAKSFASSQSDLNSHADDKMQKLSTQMQTAFTAGAQGTTPSVPTVNTPSPAHTNPVVAQSTTKKVAAPAMAS